MSTPVEDPILYTLKWGDGALAANVSGRYIVAIGKFACNKAVDCDNLYAVGDSALGSAVTGVSSCGAIGQGALANLTTGICNWADGVEALFNLIAGSSNNARGQAAMRNLQYGSQNTADGEQAGSGLIQGSNNLFLGYSAGSNLQYGSNNIFIGANSQAPSTTANNLIVIGDTILGGFIDSAFNASDFTAYPGMTWTVDAGDIVTNEYEITNKKMTMNFAIATSSVGGTPNLNLRIKIPAGKTVSRRAFNACRIIDNGVDGIGYIRAKEGDQYIEIYKVGPANWLPSTNNTAVLGQISFGIQ